MEDLSRTVEAQLAMKIGKQRGARDLAAAEMCGILKVHILGIPPKLRESDPPMILGENPISENY